MSPRDIPNLISIFRILLVPPVIWLLLQNRFAEALGLFMLAGLSDGVDGYLARRFDWRSRLGSILDPLADKLLMVSVFLTLGWLEVAPWWLVGAVLARDVIIIAGGLAYHFLVGQYAMAPSLVSKANMVLQILVVWLLILAQVWSAIPREMLDGLMYGTFLMTILSGLDYVWVWSRKALQAGKQQKAHD